MIGSTLFHAMLLALGLILPLGPQNAFLLSQGATHHRFRHCFPAIIAAGLSDTLLISAAILGVSAIVIALPMIRLVLVIFGVIFLAFIGYHTWKSEVKLTPKGKMHKSNWKRQVIFTLSVSLLNPHAILDSMGVIGTAALDYHGTLRTTFAVGCITVSWLWFISITLMGRYLTRIDRRGHIRKHLNHFAAIVMWLSACYLVYLNLLK